MIVIIDYGLGNLGSVKNAFDRLNTLSIISSDPLLIKRADRLILPGVGAAGQGIENLRKRKLDRIIINEIKKNKPFLGICLGMQLLFSFSEEGNVNCLNIIQGKVKRFPNIVKVPQIGWNEVGGVFFYFVNSYYCVPKDKSVIAKETEYGVKFCSILKKDNILATQFHPEKSGKVGEQFIKDWINI